MGLIKRKEKNTDTDMDTDTKKEDSQPATNISDLEIHLKYWEFVFSRFIQDMTERTKKTLEKVREFLSLEFSRKLLKRFMDSVGRKNQP